MRCCTSSRRNGLLQKIRDRGDAEAMLREIVGAAGVFRRAAEAGGIEVMEEDGFEIGRTGISRDLPPSSSKWSTDCPCPTKTSALAAAPAREAVKTRIATIAGSRRPTTVVMSMEPTRARAWGMLI